MRNAIDQGLKNWNGTNGVVVYGPGETPPPGASTIAVKTAVAGVDPEYDATAAASIWINARQGSYYANTTIFLQGQWGVVEAFDCSALTKVIAHEMGHLFGLGHISNYSGYPTELMQGPAPLNNILGPMRSGPNDCDRERAREALTFTRVVAGLEGDSPADQTCNAGGVPGLMDSNGCCIAQVLFSITGYTNIKPVGHIMAPLNNSVMPVGWSGSIKIDVKDLDGTITRVGWYTNGQLMYTAFSAPWEAPYSNVPAGTYTVQAAVYDSADQYSWTEPITVTVGNFYARDTLSFDEKLWPGWTLVSSNSAYYARLEGDGRLVLYRADHSPVMWTNTAGTPAYAHMERSGNFVLRLNPANPQVAWQTFTAGNPGNGVRVMPDGRIAVIRRNGSIAWQVP